MSRKLLARGAAVTLPELVDQLQDLATKSMAKDIYVTINSDSIRLDLIEEMLSDGSVVYQIELSETTKGA